jgi:hypothetical protein
MKEEGLKLLDEVKKQFDLRIVTEVMNTETLDAVAQVRRCAPDRRPQHAELLPPPGGGQAPQAAHDQARA